MKFLNYFINFFRNIEYPGSILPCNKFVKTIDFNNLGESNNPYLIVRKSLVDQVEQTYDKFGLYRDHALFDSERSFKSMSMNLLGGKFEIKHLAWRQTGFAMANWDGIKTFKRFHFGKDQLIKDKRCVPIVFDLKKIMEIEVPYQKSLTDKNMIKDEEKKENYYSKSEDEIIRDNKKRLKKVTFDFTARPVIEHKPSNSNYWHVQLEMKEGKKEGVFFKEFRTHKVDQNEQHFSTKVIHIFNQQLKKQSNSSNLKLIPALVNLEQYLKF